MPRFTHEVRGAGYALVWAAVWLAGAGCGPIHGAPSAGAETAATSSWQVANQSRISILGSQRTVVAQTITTGPGTPPKNWRTMSNLVLPRVSLAFGEYIEFVQNGVAQGVIESGTGKVTLDLPLLLRDSSQSTQSFTAYLTTGSTNGVDSDGDPYCSGGPSDPSACRGTARAPSGSFRMVAIVNIPEGGHTLGSGALLLMELSGTLTLSCAGTVCTALDACHTAGTCDPATGLCSNPNRPNGTSCDDGNACTRTDTCQSGACVGASPVVCTASDACHNAGTCSPATGLCSNPSKPNGTGCNDANACTRTDTCQSGTCTGGNPVVCSASNSCHDIGTCNSATGVCSNPSKPDGATCSDGNGCTRTDVCQAGSCSGGNPVVCTAMDACHNAGTCNPSTGVCTNPNKSNGTTCNDGNACTRTDTCQAGTCTGGNPVVCSASDACHAAGTCNASTGLCSNPNRPDGTTCNDGNACTRTDSCQAGSCTGGNPVVCSASNSCHDAGTCNPSTGSCSNPAKPNGASCSDGNGCTQTDSCQSGTCTGSNPVVCTAINACHNAGTCNASTGACSTPNKTNGTSCNDGNACTRTDTCQSGTCTGSNPVVCTASNACHDPGTCNPANGVCSNPNKPDGTPCNDANACTTTDACQSGACVGSSLVVCASSDSCRSGTCNTATGACSYVTQPNGTACDDGSACTAADRCTSGVCAGVATTTGEVDGGLRVARSASIAQVSWNPAARSTVSDVVRGVLGQLPVGATPSETCLRSGLTEPRTSDDAATPIGGGFWYLVRGNGPCGAGPYGFQGLRGAPSTERETTVCLSPCHTASDCPGTDTECRSRLCSAGACSFTYTGAGTPIADPHPGDCHRSVCDGAGGTTSVADNTDVPVDGNACTTDVCSGGTPSNPAAPVGTPCSLGASAGTCGSSGACEPCGGSFQRCCPSYPACRPGLTCQSGLCR